MTTSPGRARSTCTTKAGAAPWTNSARCWQRRRRPMPQASSEILIKCPREELYAFLADPENDPKWRSGVLDLKRVSGSGIGARYTQGVQGPGGRRIPADIEITELTPDESIAFQTVTGPVRPRGRYLLADS